MNSRTPDIMEYRGRSLLQHGPLSSRVYLMKLDRGDDPEEVADHIDRLCREKGYGKSFAKIRSWQYPVFSGRGYIIEAFIPDFFSNHDDCLFVSRFYDKSRAAPDKTEASESLKQMLAEAGFRGGSVCKPGSGLTVSDGMKEGALKPVMAVEKDADALAAFYGREFPVYPFPLYDKDYILKTMRSNVDYFIVAEKGEIFGASSAERDDAEGNAEMTDFAVKASCRGRGYAGRLLCEMERHLARNSGIRMFYTIARLNSPSMNKVFLNSSYRYSGTLAGNTGISTGIESMNVWYRHN